MHTIVREFKDFWIAGDPTRRGRLLAFATCLMAAYGFLFSTLGGRPRTETAHQALVFGGVIMMLAPLLCKRKADLPNSNPSKPKRNMITLTASVLGIFLIGQTSFFLQGRAVARSLQGISEGQASESDLGKTARLLVLAGNSGVAIPQSILDAAYHRLAGTSERPRDWYATLALTSYETTRNYAEPWEEQLIPEKALPKWLTEYEASYRIRGQDRPKFYFRGKAPIDQAVQFLPLGMPDPRIGKMSIDDREMKIEGGVFRLDNVRLRNVTFVNATIHYGGSPFLADKVNFIRCSFIMENTARSRELVVALYSQRSMDIKFGI